MNDDAGGPKLPDSTAHLDEVLQRLAIGGPDPSAVTEYAMGAVSARMRRNRVLGAGAAALVILAGVGALLSTAGDDPDEVVATATTTTTEAERVETTESTAPATVAPITLPVTTAAPITLPTTTIPVTAPPVVLPAPTLTSTTQPVDLPGTGQLVIADGAAGDLLDLNFEWNDPDGPGVEPVITVTTDEPGVVTLQAPGGGTEPCSGGPGTSASVRDKVQFASTGTRVVQVHVGYCQGPPQVFSATVEVGDPTYDGGPGRAVVAQTPKLNASAPKWTLTDEAGTTVYNLVVPQPNLTYQMGTSSGYTRAGLVLVVPAGVTGTISYHPDGETGPSWVGALPPAVKGGPATIVAMQNVPT
ncbi:MAG: hypothetical protein ACK5O2_08505 [Microthrixaceae bacterium]